MATLNIFRAPIVGLKASKRNMLRSQSGCSLRDVVDMPRTNPTQLKGLTLVSRTTKLLVSNPTPLWCPSRKVLPWTPLVCLATSSRSWLQKLSCRISTVTIRIASSNSEIIKTNLTHKKDNISSSCPQLLVLGAKVSKEWRLERQGMEVSIPTIRFQLRTLETRIPRS